MSRKELVFNILLAASCLLFSVLVLFASFIYVDVKHADAMSSLQRDISFLNLRYTKAVQLNESLTKDYAELQEAYNQKKLHLQSTSSTSGGESYTTQIASAKIQLSSVESQNARLEREIDDLEEKLQ